MYIHDSVYVYVCIYRPVGLEPVLQEAVFLNAVVEEGEQLPVVPLSRILRKR
jgi:hypothetical protein